MSNRANVTIVSYQCTHCFKMRNLIRPVAIKLEVDSRGYNELIDVHSCKDNEISANICFVDANNAVRSQVRIKPSHLGYEVERDFSETDKEQNPFTMLGLPLPQTMPFKRKTIPITIKKSNILGIYIKDKIRKSEFIIGKQQEGKAFNISSELGFIETILFISEHASDKIYSQWKKDVKTTEKQHSIPFSDTKKWIQKVTNEIESILIFDEEILPLLVDYLENSILKEPTLKKFEEIELLLNSKIALAIAEEKQLKIFEEKGTNSIQGLTIVDFVTYKELLQICMNNTTNSVWETYKQVENKLKFSEYISILSDLITSGLLNLHKLSFTTVTKK